MGRRLFGDVDVCPTALWVSDGTPSGTDRIGVKDPYCSNRDTGFLASWHPVLNRRQYFVGASLATGPEPWSTAGTRASTRLERDINPGRDGSQPRETLRLPDRILFTAKESMHGRELWVILD
jgi:ELWxxDGT repeat protein